MKKIVLVLLSFVMAFAALAQQKPALSKETLQANAAVATLKAFRKTSPLKLNAKRLELLKTMEVYSDGLPPAAFKEYLLADEETAAALERTVPILYAYRAGFDKVLQEVQTSKVEQGSTHIWLLYNMGFVIKTPSGCFGIDLDHRLAAHLAPHLDFLYITHNHADHYNMKLIAAMVEAGKPVISNFYTESAAYYATRDTVYQIDKFKIRTSISDHLLSPDLPSFVAMARIDCGEDSGNFSMLHCGDSGFDPTRFKAVQGPVDMLVLRWGAPRENNILGTGAGQVQTNYALLSHLIELRHNPYPKGQASILQTLKHLPNVQCENTLIPFWGEKLVWKNGKLN